MIEYINLFCETSKFLEVKSVLQILAIYPINGQIMLAKHENWGISIEHGLIVIDKVFVVYQIKCWAAYRCLPSNKNVFSLNLRICIHRNPRVIHYLNRIKWLLSCSQFSACFRARSTHFVVYFSNVTKYHWAGMV